MRDFGKDFFGVDNKRNPLQGSRFYVKQLYHDVKTVWNSVELFFFFNWTFFGLRSGPLDFFWVRVKPEGLFLGLSISPHSHIPVANIPEYPSPRTPWA